MTTARQPMYCFVVTRKPKSYNSWKSHSSSKKDQYRTALIDSLKEYCPDYELSVDDLYGLIYHFYHKPEGLDADNLSKPIWDCLCDVLYGDDNQVKLRIAGSFNLSDAAYDYTALDFTGLPGDIASALLNAFEKEQHVLYVECGRFTTDMIRLNMNQDAN